jgi:hypothetical protein
LIAIARNHMIQSPLSKRPLTMTSGKMTFDDVFFIQDQPFLINCLYPSNDREPIDADTRPQSSLPSRACLPCLSGYIISSQTMMNECVKILIVQENQWPPRHGHSTAYPKPPPIPEKPPLQNGENIKHGKGKRKRRKTITSKMTREPPLNAVECLMD